MAFGNFKYIQQDYVPRHNLEVIGQTYDFLQQRHDATVAQESAIKQQIAQLDLNSAEDEWKTNLANSIESAVTENMVDDYKGYALDDVIAKQGDILSNPGLVGRLRAQQEYKTYQENLDKRNDISEDKKNYFREMNQYSYQDKVDENGNVVGGTSWKPIDREVSEVPLSEIIKNGIAIAAKESGGGTDTRWIDINGKVTNDPSMAYDGETYNSTTNKWERLSRDKIRQGINAFIESTPGAKASLDQDYKVEMWKHNKLGSNPNIEDKNGVILTPEQFLEKRISPAIEAATYNNSITQTTYGNGLKTYKAAQKAAANSDVLGATYTDGVYSSAATPITVDYDYGGNLQTAKQNSTTTLKEAYKYLTGNDINIDVNNATSQDWNNALQKALTDSKIAPAQKAMMQTQIRKQLRDLEEANINYNQIISKLTPEQKETFDFVSKINGAAEIDSTSKYGKEIISYVNNFRANGGKTIRVEIGDDDSYTNLISILNGDTKSGMTELGYKVGVNNQGKKYIDYNLDNYNQIVNFANAIIKTKDSQSFISDVFRPMTFSVLDKNGNRTGNPKANSAVYSSLLKTHNIYNNASNKVKDDLSLVAPQQITINNQNLAFSTFTEQKLMNAYDLGFIEEKQYNLKNKQLSDDLVSKLVGHNYAQTDLYAVEDKKGYGTLGRKVESKDRINIGKDIISAIGNNKYKISAAHNPVHGNGSNITIYPSLDKEGKAEGTPVTYFVPNLIGEEAGIDFNNSSTTKANDNITIGNEVGKTIYLTTEHDTPITGAQRIQCLGNNQFIYNIGQQSVPVSRESAVMINKTLNDYIQIKDNVVSGAIYQGTKYTPQQINENIKNNIGQIATTIANSYGKPDDATYLFQTLYNDLTK